MNQLTIIKENSNKRSKHSQLYSDRLKITANRIRVKEKNKDNYCININWQNCILILVLIINGKKRKKIDKRNEHWNWMKTEIE